MTEMQRLRKVLDAMGVRWWDYTVLGKQKTCYMGRDGMVAVICGPDTYGGDRGLLEAWSAGQEHAGFLIAERVLPKFPPLRKNEQTRP